MAAAILYPCRGRKPLGCNGRGIPKVCKRCCCINPAWRWLRVGSFHSSRLLLCAGVCTVACVSVRPPLSSRSACAQHAATSAGPPRRCAITGSREAFVPVRCVPRLAWRGPGRTLFIGTRSHERPRWGMTTVAKASLVIVATASGVHRSFPLRLPRVCLICVARGSGPCSPE